ncbi:MAG: hypothetical protein K0Q96_2027 [Rubrobacteraceae bacterium]|nr:hypothetical protein [Rubrobacteraceae bacterium]
MDAPRSDMFRKLLQRDPTNPMVLYSLGNELFKEGRYGEARDLLQRAVANKPDYLQTVKEIDVFLRRLQKRAVDEG